MAEIDKELGATDQISGNPKISPQLSVLYVKRQLTEVIEQIEPEESPKIYGHSE